MRQILELLAIPALISALANILTSNLRLPVRIRLPVVVALGLAAFSLVLYVRNYGGAANTLRHESGSIASPKVPPESAALEPNAAIDRAHADSPRSSPLTSSVIGSINASPRRSGSQLAWTVLIYGDNGRDYPVLRAVAQEALSRNDISMPSLFRSSTPDRVYDDIFVANESTLSGLKPFCDGVVIGKVKRNTSPSDQLSGMFTSHIGVDVKLVSVASGPRREFVVEDNGAGFSAEDSESKAEQRLSEKLRIELAKFSFR